MDSFPGLGDVAATRHTQDISVLALILSIAGIILFATLAALVCTTMCICGLYILDRCGLVTTYDDDDDAASEGQRWLTRMPVGLRRVLAGGRIVRSSGAAAEGRGGGGLAAAAAGSVVLSSFKISTSNDVELASECAICLAEFKESEECRSLPKCLHIFHVDCIDKWLAVCSNMTCPLCRASLRPHHGDVGEEGTNAGNNSDSEEEDNLPRMVLPPGFDEVDSQSLEGNGYGIEQIPNNLLFWGDHTQVHSHTVLVRAIGLSMDHDTITAAFETRDHVTVDIG